MMGFVVAQLIYLILMLGGVFAVIQHILLADGEALAHAQSLAAAKEMEASLHSVQTTASQVAGLLRVADLSDSQRDAIFASLVSTDPEVTAAHLAVGSAAHVVTYRRYPPALLGSVHPTADSSRRIEEASAIGKPWWGKASSIAADPNEKRGKGSAITYNLPIRSADQEIIGVVSLEITLSRLTRPLTPMLVHEDWAVTLVSPGGEAVLGHGYPLGPGMYLPSTAVPRFTHSHLALDSGWLLTATNTYAASLARLGPLMEMLAAAALLTSIAWSYFAWQRTNHLLGPLVDLSKFCVALREPGKAKQVPYPRRRDEIGVVARALRRCEQNRALDSLVSLSRRPGRSG